MCSLLGEFTLQPLSEPAGYQALTLKVPLLFPGRNILNSYTKLQSNEFQQSNYRNLL